MNETTRGIEAVIPVSCSVAGNIGEFLLAVD
jgi:hypothetical protein